MRDWLAKNMRAREWYVDWLVVIVMAGLVKLYGLVTPALGWWPRGPAGTAAGLALFAGAAVAVHALSRKLVYEPGGGDQGDR